MPRWVTGIPAKAGTATALVTPGTTWTGTPARAQARASSPPRPKTNGSPPLSRTTRCPARARLTIRSLICAWVRLCACGALPASMTSTSGSSSASSPRGASLSTTTTSASASSRRPRTVISPASPGPPPISVTVPAGVRGRSRAPSGSARSGRLPSASARARAARSLAARRGSAAGRDRDGHVAVPGDGRRPGRRGAGVIGAHAPDPVPLGRRGDGRVDGRVVGGRVDQPAPYRSPSR